METSSAAPSITDGSTAPPQAENALGRRGFLRGGAVAAGGVALATCMGEEVHAAAAGPRQQFGLIRKHEQDHVDFLLGALGASARPKPTFTGLNQTNLNMFLDVARTLENVGTGAYTGAAPAIESNMILGQTATIALIEARHAGFLNSFRGRSMTENVFGAEQSFERALTVAEVVMLAGPFIVNLNDGSSSPTAGNGTHPLTFSSTPSASNDIAILNFALALEFLEEEFYELNVFKFFGT